VRAWPTEKIVARICREAGARVRENVKLVDLNVAAPAGDQRAIEVIASGLQCRRGAHLAVDVTVRTVLTRGGYSRPRADWQDGAVARDARSDKERKYPEFAGSGRCQLVVLCIEAGGRFSAETGSFLRDLAAARALQSPGYLRKAAAAAFERRWSKMLSMAVARSLAQSFLFTREELRCASADTGAEPWLLDLLAESRFG
jgi:hypothetical protein